MTGIFVNKKKKHRRKIYFKPGDDHVHVLLVDEEPRVDREEKGGQEQAGYDDGLGVGSDDVVSCCIKTY